MLADSYFELTNYSKAEDIYKKLIAENENSGASISNDMLLMYNSNPHKGLGKVNYIENNFEQAIENFTKSIKFDPEMAFDIFSVSDYYWRGQCYEALKQYDKALEDYEKSLEFEPENQNIIKAKQRVEKLLNKK